MKIVTVGRGPQNNVIISDPSVSTTHLQLRQDDSGRYSLVDLNSRSGTFVNGRRIQGEVFLRPGDMVRAGRVNLPWLQYLQEKDHSGAMNVWMIVLIVVGGVVGLLLSAWLVVGLVRMSDHSNNGSRNDQQCVLVSVPQPQDITIAPGQSLEEAFSVLYPSEPGDKAHNIGGAKFLAEQVADKQGFTSSRNNSGQSVTLHICPLHEIYLVPERTQQSLVALIRDNIIELTNVQVHSIQNTSIVLRNLTSQQLTVIVPQGLIFEIEDEGEQNLVVGKQVQVSLAPQQSQTVQLHTYCASPSRGCPSGNARVTPYLMYAPATIYQSQDQVWSYVRSAVNRRVVFYVSRLGACINVPTMGYVGYARRGSGVQHLSNSSEMVTSATDSCVIYLNDYQCRCLQEKINSLENVSHSIFSRYNSTSFVLDVADAAGLYYGERNAIKDVNQFMQKIQQFAGRR